MSLEKKNETQFVKIVNELLKTRFHFYGLNDFFVTTAENDSISAMIKR